MLCAFQTILTGKMSVTFVDPAAFLWHCCSVCTGFADFLAEHLRKKPCTEADPYSLALYSDEVSPGNSLKPDNRRTFDAMCKVYSVSFIC